MALKFLEVFFSSLYQRSVSIQGMKIILIRFVGSFSLILPPIWKSRKNTHKTHIHNTEIHRLVVTAQTDHKFHFYLSDFFFSVLLMFGMDLI